MKESRTNMNSHWPFFFQLFLPLSLSPRRRQYIVYDALNKQIFLHLSYYKCLSPGIVCLNTANFSTPRPYYFTFSFSLIDNFSHCYMFHLLF